MAINDETRARTLDLNAAQESIVVHLLQREWFEMTEAATEEVEKAIDAEGNRDRDRVGMYASDAAWKVRRQSDIVELLEQLGVVE